MFVFFFLPLLICGELLLYIFCPVLLYLNSLCPFTKVTKNLEALFIMFSAKDGGREGVFFGGGGGGWVEPELRARFENHS